MPDTCIYCHEGFEFPETKEALSAYDDTPGVIDLNAEPKFIGHIHGYCVSSYEGKLRAEA